MDGFAELFERLIRESGIPDANIFRTKAVVLPGFFRPTKEWDMLVVVDGFLLAVLEFKSQVGPSFGNNFNNRTGGTPLQDLRGIPGGVVRPKV